VSQALARHAAWWRVHTRLAEMLPYGEFLDVLARVNPLIRIYLDPEAEPDEAEADQLAEDIMVIVEKLTMNGYVAESAWQRELADLVRNTQ
jgi:hypothetical protein